VVKKENLVAIAKLVLIKGAKNATRSLSGGEATVVLGDNENVESVRVSSYSASWDLCVFSYAISGEIRPGCALRKKKS